jgi:OOP family OmpA-OmpF porin
MAYRKILTAVAASGLVAACGTWDVEPNMNALRGASSNGTAHQAALTEEYRQIASFEYDEMEDWPDADRWATKGLMSANGVTPAPTPLAEWDIPEEHVTELAAARVQLIAALDKGAATIAPQPVAEAQAKFDCWVEQQEENWQTAHIAACREQFLNAMQKVDVAMTPKPAPAPAEPAPEIDPVSLYELFFPFDSAAIGSEDQTAIQNALEVYRNDQALADKDEVLISGHADKSGDPEYNLALSKERAEAVRNQLIAYGVKPDAITILAFGETDPAVSTADGVKNAWNRRVEILVR